MSGDATDVVIVGAGPVGLTLSILLAQQGLAATIIERQPAPYPQPRAVHFDHEVGRILQSAGIGEELAQLSEPADVYEWRNGDGLPLLRLGRAGAGPSGWPLSSMFHQPALEAALERRARALGVDIRRGCTVEHVSQHPDSVAVAGAVAGAGAGAGEGRGAGAGAGRGAGAVAGRYLVGCDGANSTVRSLVGTEMTDLGFFYDWLIVDVILHEERVFEPLNMQVCDPDRPTTVVSGGPGRRRWEFMRLEHETLGDLQARTWELLAPWDVRPDNATVERVAVYRFAARYASQWRHGRVLIAGDAAHQMPPFAGQGMCAGIRDAANLAWKLHLVLRGRSPEALLDSYDQERLPNARMAIEFSIDLGRVICMPDQAAAAARDQAMAPFVGTEPSDTPDFPGIADGVIDMGSAQAGTLFPQGLVHGRRFDDVHGAGWRLVTSDRAPIDLDPATRAWFASIGGAVVDVAADDGVYRRWFADNKATAALQRPDFHVYGTATSPGGAADLIEHLRARLSQPRMRQGAPL